MARLLVFFTLTYVLGIALGVYLSVQLLLCLAGGALLWTTWNLLRGREHFGVFIPFLLLCFVAGSLAYNLAVDRVSGTVKDYHEQRCTLMGMVADEPLWHEKRVVFPLKLNQVQIRETTRAAAGTVRITLYHDGIIDTPFSYGQEITLRGLLVVPEGKRNPGGFDYRAFLETRGMAAAFYGEADSLLVGDYAEELSPVRRFALELKEKMQAVLQANLPPEAGGLLVAILFGERQALDPGVEEVVRRSGVAHVMAVSGLHVGLLAALLYFVLQRFRLEGWPVCLLLIVVLIAYTYLTGLKPSTLRALIMISMGAAALCLGRRKDLPTAVAAAALFTLLYNPLLLFHVGLQLSYAATISILAFTAPLQRLLKQFFIQLPERIFPPAAQDYTAGLFAVTIAAQVGILPLIAYYFKEISLVALPANVLILPVMALLLGIGLPSAVLGLFLPGLASFLTLAAYPLLAYILVLTGGLGSQGFAAVKVFPPRLLEIALYYGFFLLMAWQGDKIGSYYTLPAAWFRSFKRSVRPFHVLAALLLIALPFTWLGFPSFSEKPLEVVFLDVGQGDAIFIRTPGGKNILLDAGGRPAYMEDIERVGRLVVVPYLEHQRVRKLDKVIISHPHEDHYGGLLAVLEEVPVGLLITNSEEVETESYHRLLTLAAEKGIPRLMLEQGNVLPLGPSLKMDVLGPPARLFVGTGSDVNNNSLVLRLSYREVSFLFTGDIEDAAARWLLREDLLQQSHVLKVPHHGGYMSGLSLFMEAVEPQLAVMQVGRNPFGHPHGETVSILNELVPAVYRNDHHGAVMVYSDGYSMEIQTMLKDKLRATTGSRPQNFISIFQIEERGSGNGGPPDLLCYR